MGLLKKLRIRGTRNTSHMLETESKCKNVKEFIEEITADHHVSFNSITWQWKVPDIPASDMENEVVLVFTGPRASASSNYAHVQASTYREYLKQSKWADFIMEMLGMLTRVELHLEPDGFSIYAMRNPPVWVTCSSSGLSVHFSNKQACLQILDLIEVLDWLCKSMHRPMVNTCHAGLSASYHLRGHSYHAITQSSVYGLPESSALQPRVVQPYVNLTDFPLFTQEIENTCWLSFFNSCVIVDTLFAPHDGFGKGLETSFDLMIALAASEFCLKINGSLVFLGYKTVLYPVAIDGDRAQFHLITSTQGQINPYTLHLKNVLPVDDASQFKTMKCFVGWCEDARINLGTRDLTDPIKYTGGKDHCKSLELDGYSLLGQLGAAAPLSAVVGVQQNFKFSRHRIRFTHADNYLALLQDTSQQSVVLYDAKQRRGWLVPKLSVLLHMAQRYNSCSAIPYANPHIDAEELIFLLAPCGQIDVLVGQADSYQFRKLLLELNIRMLSTAEALRESDHSKIYGFEFMDIVRNPGKGSCMKRLDIQPKRKSWLELVNLVGTVVVCSNLGEVISTEESNTRKSKKCNKVPENEDYFTATVPCLSRLAEEKGVDLIVGSDGIKFSDKAIWKLELNPFLPCNHAENSDKTCWERPGLVQKLLQRSLLCRKRQQSTQALSVNGAVVFG